VALVLAAVACACSRHESTLQERIAKAVAQGEGATIRISDVAEFEWDRFHIFPPYTPTDDIDRELGFHWPSAASTGIDQLDSFTLLVFVRSSEVVAYVKLPRRDGDFSEIKHPGGYSREDAVFVVRQEYRGEPWRILHEVSPRAA
jgi:hypothetical protein